MLNTIDNNFFENNPDKILGEFSISQYMNKIIVKGTKDDVEKYFKENLKNQPITEQSKKPDFIKEHIVFATVPKNELSVFELWKKYHEENKKNDGHPNYLEFGTKLKLSDKTIDDLYVFNAKYLDCAMPKYKATSIEELDAFCLKDKQKLDETRPQREAIIDTLFKDIKEKPKMASIKTQAPNLEKDIVKVEAFKVRTVEDNVKLYTPHLSDNDIKAFVWYNQTLGIPMTGWEKWFMTGATDTTIKATADVEYLNQQFAVIGKFQKGDVIGKTTRFTHTYNGINYAVVRKLDGQLVVVDSTKLSKSTGGSVSVDKLKPLILTYSLYYLNGDYLPLHIYSNTDYEILKNSVEKDKDFITKEFGIAVYEHYLTLITTNLMRVDAPKYEQRFKLNPFSEIARNTKAGVVNQDVDDDIDEDDEQDTVTEAFKTYVDTLKGSDFLLVAKGEFKDIIFYDFKRRFSKDEEDEKEAYKGVVANAQIECVRLFSNFCADILDTETKTSLNRQINLTYNRSMLINTTKVPVGFVSSNKFKNSSFKLMPVQIEAFKFAVSRNNWCLALTVGFGKTSVGITLLSYFVSSGALKKPLIIVPKPVLSNWVKEMNGFWLNPETKQIAYKETKGFIRQYGILTDCGFDILNIKNLDKRHRVIAKDIEKKKTVFTLATYEALEKLYIGNDEIRNFVINEWKTILTGEKEESARDWSKKMLLLEEKLNQTDRDAEIDITSFGFDGLFVDEAHRLKNMFVGVTADKTNHVSSSFKGSSSSRALRGFYISMYIQKINGRIGFLTATPFSNTPLEVYTMLCFLGYNELTKNNVNQITKFVDLFFNETVEPKVSSKNRIVYDAVMKNYKNKPILNTLLSNTFMYKDDPKEAGLKRPCIIRYPNNDFKLMLKMSQIQSLQRDLLVGDYQKVKTFMESESDLELLEYAEQMLYKYQENIGSKRGKSRGGSIVSSSKISALSPFAGSPVSVDFITDERWSELYYHSPKIRFTVDAIRNMMEYHKNRQESNSSFLIYCEVGLNILPFFKEALEKICGFKKRISMLDDEDDEKEIFDEVEIIEGTAESDAQANRRDKIQTLFNNGKVKVIIGTSTIKEGLNLQTNCATLFILTPSWNSTDINQVEGRIHRQGNKYGYARVITPVVARSMDSFIYQKYDEKKSRIADIWIRDNKGDTEDLNIEIPANKQKELILDNAKEIAKIRGDMSARAKTNLLNKSTEDYEKIESAVKTSGNFAKSTEKFLGLTEDMLKIATNNYNVIKDIPKLVAKTPVEKLSSGVKGLKNRLEVLATYYEELVEKIDKANKSKLIADVVNILDRSYAMRNYYITDNYDTTLDVKEFLIDNGYKRVEIENLFQPDIFRNSEIITKSSADPDDHYKELNLLRFKQNYGYNVMAEKLLSAEGLSLTSNYEDLQAVVEKYKAVVDAINLDIEVNYTLGGSKNDMLIPKPEYLEKLTIEAQQELDEENKYSVKSDDLGDIFANKTNPQLTYLANDLDLDACEVKYEECCDTNGKKPTTSVKVVKDEDELVVNKPEIPTEVVKLHALSSEAVNFIPKAQLRIIKSNRELDDVRQRLNEQIAECPKTYETEKIPTNDKIAQLHYFVGGSDWYIIEKDKGDPRNNDFEQTQAFGYVILNEDEQNAEFGYINIEELKQYAEIDCYWTPVKMSTLLSDDEVEDNRAEKIVETVTEKLTEDIAEESVEDKINDLNDAIENLNDLLEVQDGEEKQETLDAIENLKDLLESLQ